ncbi:ArdC family protein [Shumkonia mesophila]|uniref:ArdC family protein n=1 Tax=Shumkonia mesophila TaxID=2838854 RepID=UPI0029347021|nr:zincin-like metallopeptidase domain-containing protein [Shumkonia mesophila]
MDQPPRDLYQRVTDQIIAAIEAGAGEYRMPWNPRLCTSAEVGIPHNPVGGYAYRGINILGLWASQQAAGYETAHWATFRQWQAVGAQVRKGEKGSLTIFFKPIEKETKDSAAEGDGADGPRRSGFIIRAAWVFNSAQVEGYLPRLKAPLPMIERMDVAEGLLAASKARFIHDGPEACYVPSRDEIHLPPPGAFRDSPAFYGVAFHELIHWTGHESRCARDLRARFGSEAYAAEELVAELGAAFMAAAVGIAPEPRTDHAGYIEGWLRALRNDKRAIFTAAAKASQAADYLIGLAD